MKSIVRRIAGSFALPLAAFLLLTSLPGTAQTFSNLHSFTYNPDGGNPYAGLIMDAAGNLYGTTAQGGTGNGGTVFELVNSSGSYSEIILHRFNNPSFFGGSDGSYPYAGLIMDAAGNLYGTTWAGGTTGYGTVFELMNPTNPSNPSPGTYYETVLHSFTYNPDGGIPYAGLIMDAAGNLYGTTTEGGGTGYEGTVFELACTSSSATNSCSSFSASDTVLYTFGVSSGDGYIPNAGLIMDAAGNLYGTTAQGGTGNGGTVFELVNSSGSYSETILHSFNNSGSDGSSPYAGLIMDAAGNLYGTTWSGGTPGYGTVFELMSPTNPSNPSPGTYYETVLHSFTYNPDGSYPYAGLIMDAAGNLYGTTYQGDANGTGTVFELMSPTNPSNPSPGTYYETVLQNFNSSSDGSNPYAGLIMDAAGNLYGTTFRGGASNAGTVFELSHLRAQRPPPSSPLPRRKIRRMRAIPSCLRQL